MISTQEIAHTISAVTTSNTGGFTPHLPNLAEPEIIEKDFGRLPLKGDTVEVSYIGGTKNDPVRVIHCNYYGDAVIRYTEGTEDKISLFNHTDITWQITKSVYDDNTQV